MYAVDIEENDPRLRLGKLVRQRRLQMGLSQSALKARGGPGVVVVGQVERGDGPFPSGLTLSGLDRALDWDGGSAEGIIIGALTEPNVSGLQPTQPVGLGLDAEADGLPSEDVEAIRAQVRALKRARGLDT